MIVDGFQPMRWRMVRDALAHAVWLRVHSTRETVLKGQQQCDVTPLGNKKKTRKHTTSQSEISTHNKLVTFTFGASPAESRLLVLGDVIFCIAFGGHFGGIFTGGGNTGTSGPGSLHRTTTGCARKGLGTINQNIQSAHLNPSSGIYPVFRSLHPLPVSFQARAKLPKKRRRVLPVEAVRPKNPAMAMGVPSGRRGGLSDPGPGGPGGGGGGGGGGPGGTRRMNAIKHNHPGALENKLNRIGKRRAAPQGGAVCTQYRSVLLYVRRFTCLHLNIICSIKISVLLTLCYSTRIKPFLKSLS